MPTNVLINWTGVSFAGVPISRVTSMTFEQGGEVVDFLGDLDIYPSVSISPAVRPRASVTSAAAGILGSFSPGAVGTLVGTLVDAKLAIGGSLLFTLSPAIFETSSVSGQHAQFAGATATWKSYSVDVVTNPYSVSA